MATDSRFFHPFYFLNVSLMASYLPVRKMVDLSSLEQTDMMSFGLTREQQIFACAAVFYLVKLPHMTTNDARIGNLFLYFKFVVMAISVMVDLKMFIGYLIAFTLFAIFIKQPEYRGEHNSHSFKDAQEFMDKVIHQKENKAIWLIYCYASWADNCIQFSPIFAHLSLRYGTKYLKFGKIDIGKLAGIAKKYNISIKPNTKQLPTLLLIKDGEEIERMPTWRDPLYKSKGVKKVPLTIPAIETTFNLVEMCKKPKKEKEKKEKRKVGNNRKKNTNSGAKLSNISK